MNKKILVAYPSLVISKSLDGRSKYWSKFRNWVDSDTDVVVLGFGDESLKSQVKEVLGETVTLLWSDKTYSALVARYVLARYARLHNYKVMYTMDDDTALNTTEGLGYFLHNVYGLTIDQVVSDVSDGSKSHHFLMPKSKSLNKPVSLSLAEYAETETAFGTSRRRVVIPVREFYTIRSYGKSGKEGIYPLNTKYFRNDLGWLVSPEQWIYVVENAHKVLKFQDQYTGAYVIFDDTLIPYILFYGEYRTKNIVHHAVSSGDFILASEYDQGRVLTDKDSAVYDFYQHWDDEDELTKLAESHEFNVDLMRVKSDKSLISTLSEIK